MGEAPMRLEENRLAGKCQEEEEDEERGRFLWAWQVSWFEKNLVHAVLPPGRCVGMW